MPRPAIYRGDLEELKKKYALLAEKNWRDAFIDNGQCARLVQVLTDVGHTSRWQPGARVVDLNYLRPGTVIANFKIVDGRPKFPNESAWHAALFQRFEHGKIINGKRAHFTIIDQWTQKPVGERPIEAFTPEQAKKLGKTPSNNANEYFVVMVP